MLGELEEITGRQHYFMSRYYPKGTLKNTFSWRGESQRCYSRNRAHIQSLKADPRDREKTEDQENLRGQP